MTIVSNDNEYIIHSHDFRVNEKTTEMFKRDNVAVNVSTTKTVNNSLKPTTINLVPNSTASTRKVKIIIKRIIRFLFPVLAWVNYYPVKSYFMYGDLWAGIYGGFYLIPQCESIYWLA